MDKLKDLVYGVNFLLERARDNYWFLDQHYHGDEVDCGYRQVGDYISNSIVDLRFMCEYVSDEKERVVLELAVEGLESKYQSVLENRDRKVGESKERNRIHDAIERELGVDMNS